MQKNYQRMDYIYTDRCLYQTPKGPERSPENCSLSGTICPYLSYGKQGSRLVALNTDDIDIQGKQIRAGIKESYIFPVSDKLAALLSR